MEPSDLRTWLFTAGGLEYVRYDYGLVPPLYAELRHMGGDLNDDLGELPSEAEFLEKVGESGPGPRRF